MNWPWTNTEKELEKRYEESKDGPIIEIKDIDDFFDSIKNRKISFWEGLRIDIEYNTREFVWWVYRLFKPCHQRIRKVIPRRWCDLSELTLLLNFEIIKSYVEEEMDSVLWDQGQHKLAGDWLRSAYEYITKERLELQKQLDEELEIASGKRGVPYEEKYGEFNRIEKLIDQKDHDVLVKLAEYRNFLWT